MNWLRISSTIQKNLILVRRDLLQITDMIYWPILDICIWGFASTWLTSNQANNTNGTLTILTAFTLFHVMSRTQLDISISLVQELWDKNLLNLFSSPLTIGEWSVGVMLLGALKSIFTVLFCATAIWMLFGLNVFSLGPSLFLFVIPLVFSGWSFGFFIAGMLMSWGQRAQGFIWSIMWLFASFCGVFYPISVLPSSARIISHAFPITYVFEGLRHTIATNELSLSYIYLSFVLSILYFAVSYQFFKFMFKRSVARGLSRLEYE